jgi:para-nitrobenzyl esterase
MIKVHFGLIPAVGLILILVFAGCRKEDDITGNTYVPREYLDKVYDDLIVETVPFTTDGTLLMDIYRPKEALPQAGRPVIVMAHGGAFIEGTRNLPDMVRLCRDFASRGYVTASFSYRLGAGPQILSDSLTTLGVVIRAVHDGMAAVRFLRKTFAEDGNPYGIDTSRIFGLGNSAGAVLLLHQIFMRDEANLPPHIVNALQAEGGLEGNRGHALYASHLHAMINLAGGINAVNWITDANIPIASAQGSEDPVVPFNCGPVFANFPPLNNRISLCGSNTIHSAIAEKGFRHELLVFEGAGHCPWITSAANPTALMDDVEKFVAKFLYENAF